MFHIMSKLSMLSFWACCYKALMVSWILLAPSSSFFMMVSLSMLHRPPPRSCLHLPPIDLFCIIWQCSWGNLLRSGLLSSNNAPSGISARKADIVFIVFLYIIFPTNSFSNIKYFCMLYPRLLSKHLEKGTSLIAIEDSLMNVKAELFQLLNRRTQ